MSKTRSRITEKGVQYYILIQNDKSIYTLGSIKIDKFNGDIYYFPSFSVFFELHDDTDKERREINYLSFHKSGEFHVKVKEGIGNKKISRITTCILELGKECLYGGDSEETVRTPIKDIKYQNMFDVIIKDISKLKKFEKKIHEVDLLFNVSNINIKDSIKFSFSIISGKLLSTYFSSPSINNRIKSHTPNILIRRCLGSESNNADKMLQYSISETQKDQNTGNITLSLFLDNPLNKE